MAVYIIVYGVTWYITTKKIQDIDKLKKFAKVYLGFQMMYGLFWFCWFITGNIFVFGDSRCYAEWPVGYAIGAVILVTGYCCILTLCCLVVIFQASIREKEKEVTKETQEIERKLDAKEEHSSEHINTHNKPARSKDSNFYKIPNSDLTSQESKHHKHPSDFQSRAEFKEDYETKMHKMVKRLKQNITSMKIVEPKELKPEEIEYELEVDKPPAFEPKFRYNIK